MGVTLPKVSFFKVLKNASRILKNPLPFHQENFEKHGNTFKVQLGWKQQVIFTRDSGFTKHMLQKQHKKYEKSKLQTKELGKYIGNGLLTANGEQWLKQRRLIQPAFHRKKIETLMHIVKDVVVQQVSTITPHKEVDIYPLTGRLAFNAVAKSLFSYEDNDDLMAKLMDITNEVQIALIKEIRQPYKRWWFYLSGTIKNTKNISQEGRDILRTLIAERKASKKTYNDLLNMLLATKYDDGSAMETEQLIDEILILFVAGHDTTSNALAFAMMLLALHPEIQDKVYQEVEEATAQAESLMDQISKLKYTKQCIEETLRLYPPAYFTDRVTKEEDTYQGMKFDAGVDVLISFYEIHRNNQFWKSPEKFNPDRFDPDRDQKEYADHYFPFGLGPRMCIGNNFAMYEMILALSEVVRKYRIVKVFEKIEINPMITLKPGNSILKFEPR